MTINRAISNIVCTDSVITASIVAKLAVVAILLASMACANAWSGGSNHGGGPSHFNSQPSGSGKPTPIRNTVRPIITKSGSGLKEMTKPGSGLKQVRKSHREQT